MKKFWEKYRERIIQAILILIGIGGYAAYDAYQENAPQSLKQSADVEVQTDEWTIVFELSFYAKQRGTPDNIRVEDTFKADKLPPLADVMKGAAVPEGYEVNESLPIYIKEIRRERKVINEPPGKLPEDVPEKLPTDEE